MYAFDYHRPQSLAGAAADLAKPGRQGARRRHDPAADHEAAPCVAGRAHRSQERSRTRRHHPRRGQSRDRRDDPARGRRSQQCRASGDPGACGTRRRDRRSACSQHGHDRRLDRQQRSVRRLSGGGARARRHDRHQQAPHRSAGFFHGPVRDGARDRRTHHPSQLPDPAEGRLHEIPRTRRRATRWSASSSPRRRAAFASR